MSKTLPRDDLFRALPAGIELRAEIDNPNGMPTLHGHFSVFSRWTEIDSAWEGRFLERIAPGAFRKTIRENLKSMRVLFQHGQDPQVGDKVLGPIRSLHEDEIGAAYEVPLLDTSYNRDLIPGLEAGLYGASFRFRVMREEIRDNPGASDYNPHGLPERTIKEAQVKEFGPVTFGAYEDASAGVRSLTDEFMFGRLIEDPEKLKAMIEGRKAQISVPAAITLTPTTSTTGNVTVTYSERGEEPDPAPDDDSAEPEAHPAVSRRETTDNTTTEESEVQTIEEVRARVEEIASRFETISAEQGTLEFSAEARAEWDGLKEERTLLLRRISDWEERQAELRAASDDQRKREPGTEPARESAVTRRGNLSIPSNPWNVAEYRNLNDWPKVGDAMREGAKRVLDLVRFADGADEAASKERIERLMGQLDGEDARFTRHVLETSSPVYHRAFSKYLVGASRTAEENDALERAASLTTTAGGFAVPVTLDPTVILTSDGTVNPVRAVANVKTIAGNTWEGISSAGITAAFSAEATETTDNTPVLAQPTINVEKAQAFVPFSIEIGEDWAGFQSEMAAMFADAKDALECTKFTTGYGHATNTPEGYLKGATAVVTTATSATLAVADLYSVKNALPPRFRNNAIWIAEGTQFDRIRQLGATYGASFWTELGPGRPQGLLGKSTYENSAAPSTITAGSSAVTYGDFSNFVIVDRVGMSVELIPHLVGGVANYPTGQRGLYAYWRTSSGVVNWHAFRTIKAL